MEPKNGGLEDDVPFQLGDFTVNMLIFRVVPFLKLTYPLKIGESCLPLPVFFQGL